MENFFRKKLENARVEVPEHLWDKIQSEASLQPNSSKMSWLKWGIPSAVAIISVATWLFVSSTPNEVTTPTPPLVAMEITEKEEILSTPTEEISTSNEVDTTSETATTTSSQIARTPATPVEEPIDIQPDSEPITETPPTTTTEITPEPVTPALVNSVPETTLIFDSFDVKMYKVESKRLPETTPITVNPSVPTTPTSTATPTLATTPEAPRATFKAVKEADAPKEEQKENEVVVENTEPLTLEMPFKSAPSEGDGVYIPNAFNPLSTSGNERFRVKTTKELKGFAITILTRTGQVIYQSLDPTEGWDGYVGSELAPMGVYVYVINYTESDGAPIRKRGTVTLIR